MSEDNGLSNIKALVDWALKIGPILGAAILFFFTLYSNQNNLLKHDAAVDTRIAEIEKTLNQQNREDIIARAQLTAGVDLVRHEFEYYVASQKK